MNFLLVKLRNFFASFYQFEKDSKKNGLKKSKEILRFILIAFLIF